MIIQNFLGRFINSYFLEKEIKYHTQFSQKSYNAVINIKRSDNVLSKFINSENTKINTNYNITGITIFKQKYDNNNISSNNKILKTNEEDLFKQKIKKIQMKIQI